MDFSNSAYLFASGSAVTVNDGNRTGLFMEKKAKGFSSYLEVEEQDVAATTSAANLMAMLFDKACILLARAIQSSRARDVETFHQSTLYLCKTNDELFLNQETTITDFISDKETLQKKYMAINLLFG